MCCRILYHTSHVMSCHAMPSRPALLCPVLFTPAPSFRTRHCIFVIFSSLLLTAVALLHCTILTQYLSIHSSTPPLLCSATYSTHIFSANMIAWINFDDFLHCLPHLLHFRLNSWNARARIPHSTNNKQTLWYSKFSFAFVARRVSVVVAWTVLWREETSFYFSHSYFCSGTFDHCSVAFLQVTLTVYQYSRT